MCLAKSFWMRQPRANEGSCRMSSNARSAEPVSTSTSGLRFSVLWPAHATRWAFGHGTYADKCKRTKRWQRKVRGASGGMEQRKHLPTGVFRQAQIQPHALLQLL
jgi:hypothetical protein